jgi:hypothetical protein
VSGWQTLSLLIKPGTDKRMHLEQQLRSLLCPMILAMLKIIQGHQLANYVMKSKASAPQQVLP